MCIRDGDVIKKTVHELKDKGHVIEVLYWGKQGKMKVHGKQFRSCLLYTSLGGCV